MSSLLKKHHTPGRPASRPTPRRAALGALVAVGLLSTVFSLALAGRAAPGGTASFMPAAATAQRAAVAAPAGHTSSSGSMSSGSMSTGATKAVAIKDYAFSPSSLRSSPPRSGDRTRPLPRPQRARCGRKPVSA